MTPWPFGELTPLRYGAILADPPWAGADVWGNQTGLFEGAADG